MPPTRRRGGGFRFTQSIPSAIEALRANKGRAVLTTLGIVIGVAAVISIVALGQGSSASVTSRLAGLGTNVLTLSNASSRSSGIAAGAGTGNALKLADADAIENIQGVVAVSPIVQGNSQIIAGNQNWQSRVQGVRANYQQIGNWEVASGGFFTDADDDAAKNVVVLGQTVATNLFSQPEAAVGQYVLVRNIPAVVVGVLVPRAAASAATRTMPSSPIQHGAGAPVLRQQPSLDQHSGRERRT